MEEAEAAFRKYLAAQKLKYTPERREIFFEIMASDGHFDADELVRRMRTHSKRVSRATVYRTLDLLVKLGVLRRLSLGRRTSLYENNLKLKSTGYMVCLSCGEVEEFKIAPSVDELLFEGCRELGFRPHNRSIQVLGYCKACAAVASPAFNLI